MAEEENNKKISKYNSAELLNFALNLLWKDAKDHSRQGLFDKWDHDLDMIWGELAGDLEENCNEELKFKELCNKIYATGSLAKPAERNFVVKERTQVRAVQYKLLNDKHIWLKRLQNNLGKGSAYRDEFEDDFE